MLLCVKWSHLYHRHTYIQIEGTVLGMRSNKMRSAVVLSLALVFLLLSGCAPQKLGEEKAKEAGLAFLRQAFGVNYMDAHVEYVERDGTSVVDGKDVHHGSTAPTEIYIVTISDNARGEDLYYAEVDAVTGVAYYGTKNERLLAPMTEEQKLQAEEIAALSSAEDADGVLQGELSQLTVCNRLVCRFQKEVALMTPQAGGCCVNRVLSPRACIGYFVTFADGAMYRVEFSWPTFELEEVQSLGIDTGNEVTP